MRYLILLLIGCSFLGCKDNSIRNRLTAGNKENYQKACTMYVVYSRLNGNQGPASTEEMIEFLSTDEKAAKRLNLVGMDTGSLNDYLVGRDGEPFKFRWSVKANPMSPPYPICFEENGVDGVRQVGFSGKKMMEVTDDAEYNKLLTGQYRAPKSERYNPNASANNTPIEELPAE